MPSDYTRKGLVFVLVSAVFFSIAGVLIKVIPWNPVSINGARCVFAIIPLYVYLRVTGRRFHVNKQIVAGAVLDFAMLETFVIANKLTTAANAIVLQFTEPIWVIMLGWIVFRSRPHIGSIATCIVVLTGIVCFFLDSLGAGEMWGNLIAIVSGLAYAGVFLIKKMPQCDFECAAILAFAACFVVGIPFYVQETVFTPEVIVSIVVLGVVQLGLAYLFLSKGLDSVSPVTASLTSTIEPILNPILVALAIGETIGPVSIFGALLVVGAATAYNVWMARVPET
jgi:drug/metabolite transporter (DMT)-like permease